MTESYRWLDFGLPRLPDIRRKVFVSYHHDVDQIWYDSFAQFFCQGMEIFTNRSLQEPVDSDDLQNYVHRYIREHHITGTSVTIVLCGLETWKRKCVDWEIGSTVNKGHALLGIALPTALRVPAGIIVPDRLYHNWLTGYAEWILWEQCSPEAVGTAVESAIARAGLYSPDNSWPFMTRNRP